MQRVKSKNTSPELTIRSLLRGMGESGYRLHRTDIPGKPDVAWIGRRLALFIHGCFWHGHSCPRGARIPKTHRAYWQTKIKRNSKRDAKHHAALRASGWRVLILWECKLDNKKMTLQKISRFLDLR